MERIMARDRFMFFPNFKATADKLDDKTRMAFYDAITNYVFNDLEPQDPIVSALLEAIKPSLDKVDGRQNNGGNHNPNGVNQHTKVGQSGQIRSKLVNSGQSLSETETEVETETKEKEISNDISKKNPIDFDTPFQAGGQLWELPAQFRKLALTKYTESEIRAFEMTHSCHENPEQVCLNDIKHQPKPKTTRFVKPTVEEIAAYCEERNNGINAEYFFDSYEGKGWLIGKTPMKDWKAAVRTWEKRTPKPQTTISVNFTELVALWNDMASRLKLQPVSESDLMPERKAEIEKIVATKKPKDLKTLIAQLEQVIKKSPKLLGRQDEIGDDGRWFTKELGWQASFAFCFSTKGWSDIMAGKYNGEMK
jgi:hypothetical protein